jgi:integrase/recombinase XerD
MLQDAIDSFIASLSNGESHSKRNTIMAYHNDLRQLSRYLEQQGLEEWRQVIDEHITGYLLTLGAEQTYRPATIARKFAAIKSFFRYMRSIDLIATNPVESMEAPHARKALPQVLSAEQVARLFAQVSIATLGGQRDLAMLHLLYATGMRSSEIVALNIDDFDPVLSIVVCPDHKERARQGRIIPLPPVAVDALLCYLTQVRPRLLRHIEERALFLNHLGERLTRQGFWLIIKGYARQAGIIDITPHMLRHSFALHMLNNGMKLRSVQELLGHAHISTTQVYYRLSRAVTASE